ncbi:GTP cyclohydrolase II [Novosphingopyxis sp. YJ-S2-01]|uniref:GTP cyclohydrolase II n=1 Tax=Novosphingopyxis sp. YJ-S2-01 TaxID=2794021 RepID=UPI0018DDBD31|nr:GTP cyclohydrolase II [Novosphingopyxis sp. YJ-S2-01]MBH9536376.1 GTP cyclohydrolase II [Novosphingopyxis sp. YJ-S2-01]
MSQPDDARRAARAIDALRRGWPVRIEGKNGALTVRSVETLFEDAIPADATLLISAERAATLKIVNQREAAHGAAPVLIKTPEPLTGPAIIAIADPSRDLATPFKGPFTALALDAGDAARGGLELARHAGLLPALLVLSEDDAVDHASTADIAAYRDPAQLRIAARARLPVLGAEDSHITVFRAESDAREHVALMVGSRRDGQPLVRLHSECLTGDVFGSLKCDCGPQLAEAVRRIDDHGWGVLLYLRQEGRGIGLVNKLRAYDLQDQGFDTVDANRRLGFADDARDFAVAARMLGLLGIDAVRLLTNNPAKVAGLEKAGIAVKERVPIQIAPNPHNHAYLDTKRDRSGHQL